MAEQMSNTGGAVKGLACRSCRRPIKDEFYVVAAFPCCPTCVGYLRRYRETCRFSLGAWMKGLAAGLPVALACAWLWAWSAGRTPRQDGIGILSLFIGVAVSKVVVAAMGRRRGTSTMVLTVGLSLLSVLMAKGLMAAWTFWPQVQARGILADLAAPWRRVSVFLLGFLIQMRMWDILWYVIAFLGGWMIGRLPYIPISGPHRPEELRAIPQR